MILKNGTGRPEPSGFSMLTVALIGREISFDGFGLNGKECEAGV